LNGGKTTRKSGQEYNANGDESNCQLVGGQKDKNWNTKGGDKPQGGHIPFKNHVGV